MTLPSTSVATAPSRAPSASVFQAALAAAAVTIPHAIGLGLLAYAPLAGAMPVTALALWSAAVPGAIAALASRRPGVVYAPTTVVALLYATIVATVSAAGARVGMGPEQVLAAGALTVALAMLIQWLFGLLRLASLARFLPISVMHGFAAGVGLAMILGQLRAAFGQGHWSWDGPQLLHAATAAAVILVARGVASRWARGPAVLIAIVGVTLALTLPGLKEGLVPAAPAAGFALPPIPDFNGTPWLALLRIEGWHLVSLAFLMAVVNSLEILVFNQELALEHGEKLDADAALRRESAVGVLCALTGLLPASTSASRTRIVLAQAGPAAWAGHLHAGMLVAVALTGHLWLHDVPMAALAGALVLTGFSQVPRALWSRTYAQSSRAAWLQGWLVAIVFCVAGGVGALVAGLVVATFVLLHDSASNTLRRCHLDGELRSRCQRRAASEAWLASSMRRVAVIELQGVMSFGVAAHMGEQVLGLLLPRHERLILDVHRVAAWDATALVQLRALERNLAAHGCQLAVCGIDARSRLRLPATMLLFPDVDRGLEWAEDALLQERPAPDGTGPAPGGLLGELGEGIPEAARWKLEDQVRCTTVEAGERIFAAGDRERDLYVVLGGRVTVATSWPATDGLRLSTVRLGMPLGEMAFLNGQPRTAYAGVEHGEVQLATLRREDFDAWAATHPQEALAFLGNLAMIGTRRLGATTRQLRAVLE